MERLDEGKYDREDYYANLSDYHSVFAEKVHSSTLPRDINELTQTTDRTVSYRAGQWSRLAVRLSTNYDFRGYARSDPIFQRPVKIGRDSRCIMRFEGEYWAGRWLKIAG
jgi:hypothetical protein